MVSHQVTGSSTEKGETQIIKLQEQSTNKNNCFPGICIKDFIQPTYHFVSCI